MRNCPRSVPIYRKDDKTDCSNYRTLSLFPITYKMLSDILLSKLNPYAEEIIGDHQCGLRRTRSTTDHIYFISQILEKNWNTMRQLSVIYRLQKSSYFCQEEGR
jgi:hypothetical protein